MHYHAPDTWIHSHVFVDDQPQKSERRALAVVALTATAMVAEIIGGLMFHSLALLADGWHMASHAAAIGITVFAYWFARSRARDPRFTFGTGKVGALGGFSSAIVLGVVAILMAWESVWRFITPLPIAFDAAIAVAVVGLLVNLLSAWLLWGSDNHHHHDHHGHDHRHRDHNLRAAFVHVVADALTSVLAIIALLTGKMLGWVWLDPAMGLVGAVIIGKWTLGLLRETSRVLLDAENDEEMCRAIRQTLEADADTLVTDLHLWRIGPRHLSVIVCLVTHDPRPTEHYKNLLASYGDLAHVTIEINRCPGEACAP